MEKCIKSTDICIGRDCRELALKGNFELCCLEEIKEEKKLVQNVIDVYTIVPDIKYFVFFLLFASVCGPLYIRINLSYIDFFYKLYDNTPISD